METRVLPASDEALTPPGAAALGAERRDSDPGRDRLTMSVEPLLAEARRAADDKERLGRAFDEWLKRNFEGDSRRKFGQELWRVRHRELPRLRTLFFTELPEAKTLVPWKRSRGPSDPQPLRLLETAVKSGDPVKRFEATRDLSLAFFFCWIITDAEKFGIASVKEWGGNERRYHSPARHALSFLRRNKVVQPPDRKINVRTFHDQANHNRCLGIKLEKNEWFLEPPAGEWLERQTDANLVTLECEPQPVRALLVVRRKGIMQTIAKMFLQGFSNPLSVPDRRGVRFAFRNREEFEAGVEHVWKRLSTNGTAQKRHRALSDLPINPYAAPNLVMGKDMAKYGEYWEIEIQYLLATQHVDLLYSTGEENSLLYHRRQYSVERGLFQQIFPPELYGVDWSSPEVQAALDRSVVKSLRW
ncbi:hypothetical protein EPN90_02560 [Patescibacteria group bacterium]|nr:MAG: hypothetical protein EPN90_02560 [Patescibacteria group bacterium]